MSVKDSEAEQLAIEFDGLKISYEQEYEQEVEEGKSDLDIDDEIELEMVDDVKFGRRLAEMVEKENKKDVDWVPRVLQQEPRQTIYIKGPDVMSKSKRMQQRYQHAWRNQSSLNKFGFYCLLSIPDNQSTQSNVKSPQAVPRTAATVLKPLQDHLIPTSTESEPNTSIQLSGRPQSATVLSDLSTDEDVMAVNAEGVVSDDKLIEDGSNNLEEVEVWEDELQESIAPTTKIHDWETLRAQIQLNLKKKHKYLPLSQINQLMILSNFAMLRIKGAT
ncbi:hypothetical protein PAXRUDRAFT_15258 [Paxillus rubicundulus Ve08.2h10]|uniref:Uncharacterized protein n=1 Tax=Paxillus rubicundulus Ve08.2h10 TaxID=930991 RepID=A0A0D0DBF1_9AGAM|nr:hypothetical protein PAXRUDRAFT_15258 [Paxillus rubicundulus Ve08.2h10]